MNLRRIDHTAIAVSDLDEALARYHRLLGLQPSVRAVVADQQIEMAFLPVGDGQLELIQPTTADSGVARFLARRGEGLHHIGVLVDDIAAELQRLADGDFELIDRVPRRGAHGLIAFIHPRASGGVLVELIQRD